MAADFIITITDRSRSGEFAAWFQQQGATLVLTALGRGTATMEILDYLGLEASEKAVLLCMLPSRSGLLRKAARELWLDVPGRGVMMAVPVFSIGGASAKAYLLQGEAENRMEKEGTHERMIVIANQGFTDKVMDAARAAGATGGTAVHAKGTGTELAKKFFGVSLAAEKELIFILSAAETRKPIMKAIMEKAGMQTDAQALAFSLPVTDLAGLRQLLAQPKVAAIGEIGLDYYWAENPPRDFQQMVFRKQLALAEELDLPVIVHDREAHGDSLSIIREFPAVTGVFHCFSGSPEMAEELLKRGWYLGFDGPITYKNARRAPEVAAITPLERMVVETDAPYLSPVPVRGRRNDSRYLPHVIAKLAEWKGVTPEEMTRITCENGKRLFRLG